MRNRVVDPIIWLEKTSRYLAREMIILQTDRLTLRRLDLEDAPFIVELLNDPDFLRFIGDRGVRNPDDARKYLRTGPMASYREHGFGLFMTQLRDSATPIGICGLLRRPTLPDVDVGFAFLPAFRNQGYASESAAAVIDWGRQSLGLERIIAITSPDNTGSARVLERIGLRSAGLTRLAGEGTDVRLFVPFDDKSAD